jgi:hypothetical protein
MIMCSIRCLFDVVAVYSYFFNNSSRTWVCFSTCSNVILFIADITEPLAHCVKACPVVLLVACSSAVPSATTSSSATSATIATIATVVLVAV